jgi:4'-phosphopantetheinyl transferase
MRRQLTNGKAVLVKIQPRASLWSEDYLTSAEKGRYRAIRQKSDRVNYLAAHSVVNKLFLEWIGCEADELPKAFGTFHKPYVDTSPAIEFNISHTNGCAVAAFYSSAIGVDVEYIDGSFDYAPVAEESFTANKRKCCERDREMFYRLWVAKEAYLKRLGTGLHKPMTDVEMIAQTADSLCLTDKETGDVQEIALFSPYPNIIAGLCATEEKIQ